MLIGLTRDQREQRNKGLTCTPWFAWRPVQLEDGRWCWLDYIWRRWECDAGAPTCCAWTYSEHHQ